MICYPVETLPSPDLPLYHEARAGAELVDEVLVLRREAAAIEVPAGHFLRMQSVDGPQVGDLNLFAAADLAERFYSGKTRALHGTHTLQVTACGRVFRIYARWLLFWLIR